jgi:type I restriction enzyme, S subunit
MELRSNLHSSHLLDLPHGWTKTSIGSIAESVSSGRSSTESTLGDTPIYGSTGIIGWCDKADYSGEAILIARVGANAGKLALVDGEYCVSDNTIILYLDTTIPRSYVWRQLVAKNLNSLVYGSGQPLITGTLLKGLSIPLPPTKAEQEAIAEALSDADAYIESLEQLIAKKRLIKQGVMQELLTGNLRLPGFSGEWDEKRLGDIFEITSSKRVFQSEWKTEGIPFYRARELAVLGQNNYVNNELFISKSLYKTFKSLHSVPKVGDMLVTGVGTLGKVYVVPDEKAFYFKDGNIIWFKIGESLNAEYLKQLYNTRIIKKQIKDDSSGTTVGTYTISGAQKTKIPFPSIHEQNAIADILRDHDLEISAIESKLEKARQIKQGMMQELLTGRIRLV